MRNIFSGRGSETCSDSLLAEEHLLSSQGDIALQ